MPGGHDRNVCRHFLVGKCEFGDDCGFLHPGVASRPLCSNFLQGWCTYAEGCKFRPPKKLMQKMVMISVRSLSHIVEEAEIVEYFNSFGAVTGVDLKKKADCSSSGCCSVEFTEIEPVAIVLESRELYILGGPQVEVKKYIRCPSRRRYWLLCPIEAESGFEEDGTVRQRLMRAIIISLTGVLVYENGLAALMRRKKKTSAPLARLADIVAQAED